MIQLNDHKFALYEIPYGVDRRIRILDLMRADKDTYHPGRIPVNGMYQPRLENDPDLKHLVKQGRLRLVRQAAGKPKHMVRIPALGRPYDGLDMKVLVKNRTPRGQTWLVLGKNKGK